MNVAEPTNMRRASIFSASEVGAVAIAAVTWGLLPGTAVAASQIVCVHFDLDPVYTDASPAGAMCNSLGCNAPDPLTCCDQKEDFGRRDELDRWGAPRLLVQIRGVDNEVLWGWRPLDGSGCTSPIETQQTTLSLDYLPWSYSDDRNASIVGFNCDADQEPERCAFETVSVNNFGLDDSGTTRVTIADPDGGGPLLDLNSLLWAASFAEERIPLWTGIVSYLVSTNDGKNVANLLVGGQPTANLLHSDARAKFTITHEFGHVQTVLQPLATFGEMFGGDDVDYSFITPGKFIHTRFSPEWQSAAALEGFAEYYSLLVWWKHDTPIAKQLGPAQDPDELIVISDTQFVRYIDFICLPFNLPECPPGVANETDWMAALWNFSLSFSTPTETLRFLSTAYMWPVNGESDAYWVNFTDSIADSVSPTDLNNFLQTANQAGIDH